MGTSWILCPSCGGKTRVRLRCDTVLSNFLRFCPKCRREFLINAKEQKITVVNENTAVHGRTGEENE